MYRHRESHGDGRAISCSALQARSGVVSRMLTVRSTVFSWYTPDARLFHVPQHTGIVGMLYLGVARSEMWRTRV